MAEKQKDIIYKVNGEDQTTDKDELTVREILEHAGNTPVEEWTLKSEDPKHDYNGHYDEVVKIHRNQRFQAIFSGPTPVSEG